jgi:hypothetical protein
MPQIELVFKLKLKDGREMEQKISANPNADGKTEPNAEQLIMQMLQQYAAVGMLKRDGKKFILVTCGMIDTVEVEIPSILTPTTSEFAKSLLG